MTDAHAFPDDGPSLNHEKKRLAPNAAFAVGQILVSSAILFLLYRYVLSSLGVEALGVWALVVAATSLANVSNLGLAGGTVRFVSKHLARRDPSSAGLAVETAALSIAAVMGLVVLLLWAAIESLLALVVPPEWIGQTRDLIPFALAALWMNSVGGAIHSGLDGCHRADLRSLATMFTQPLLLVTAMWFVPQMGLQGIAYAQILQYLVWSAVGWLLLRKQLPALPIIPCRWSRRHFIEMWRYGANFQLISLLVLLTEPIAKGLLSHFGNLAAVGYFEVANRLAGQIRAILVSANQVLVPYYSKVSELSRNSVAPLYAKHLQITIVFGTLAFSSLAIALPLISELLIGRLETQFLLFAATLSFGSFVNIFSVPAYFANLGIGRPSHNVLAHMAMTATVIVIGATGGKIFGAFGSAAALPLALIAGAIVTILVFHRSEKMPLREMAKIQNIRPPLIAASTAFLGLVPYYQLTQFHVTLATVTTIIALLANIIFFVFISPETRALRSDIANRALHN